MGDTVLPVARRPSTRGEADGGSRRCVLEDRSYSPKVRDQQATFTTSNFLLHKQPRKQRAGALMLTSSSHGWEHHTGWVPGHHSIPVPFSEGRLWGGSSQQHSTSQNESKLWQINEVNAFQLSSIIHLWVSQLPIPVFVDSERISQFWTIPQATHDLVV